MQRGLLLLSLAAALSAARAEISIDMSDEPPSQPPGPGINVPAPIRGGTGGTNEIRAGADRAPPPPNFRKLYPGMDKWKLVPPARLSGDMLTLRNQDLLPGRFAGWDGPTVRWDYPGARAPIRIRPQGVALIRFAPVADAPRPPAPRWVVRLTTGNLLAAETLIVNAQTAEFHARGVGPLKVPRRTVAAFYHDPEPAADKFRMLHDLDEWDRVGAGQGRRVAYPGSDLFAGQSVLYRDMQLPKAALIEFDVPNTGNLHLVLHVGVSSFRGIFGEPHTQVAFSGNQVHIQGFGGNAADGGLSLTLPKTRSGFTRVGFALNHAERAMALYMDGKLEGRSRLTLVSNPKARGVILQGSNPGEPQSGCLPVRRLVVSRLGDALNLPAPKPEEDALRLANGDSMVGNLVALGTNTVTFVSGLGRLDVPLERVVGGSFAAARRAEPRRRDGDVTLRLADGSDLTAELKESDPQGLVVTSDVFGHITVARNAVRSVQFGMPASAARPPSTVNPLFRDFVPGTVQLKSGEFLAGTLVGLGDGLVRWQVPDALDAMELAQTGVVSISPATGGGGPTNLPALPGRVQLVNGDTLRAEVLSLDRKQAQLRTTHAGLLTVERACIAWIRPGAPPEDVLDAGPLERWISGKKSHRRPATPIGREFVLPPRFSLSFEAAGEPQNWNLALWLCAKATGRGGVFGLGTGQTGYLVRFQPEAVILNACTLGGGNSWVSAKPVQAKVQDLARRGAVRITCLVDRPKNELCVLLDDKLTVTFTGGRDQKAPDGKGILFMVNTDPPLRIRDLVLAEWKSTAESLAAAPPAGDTVRLHDQTLSDGPIETIRDGFLVRTGHAPVALGKVAGVQFDPALAARARRTADDVRVTLVNGDRLTLNTPRLDERGLTGTSEAFGPLHIAADAVRNIDFRPSDPLRGP